MSNELDEFGELFMREVRDPVIHSAKALLEGALKAPSLQELQDKLTAVGHRETLEEYGVKIANEAIFKVLWFFVENEKYRLIGPSGDNLAELSDGLHGEIFTEDGWIARFSEDKRGM